MPNCIGKIAASIALECTTPIEGGYTGRNALIPYEINPTLTKDAENPRILKAVTIPEGEKVVAVENAGTQPHTGATTTGNADAGRVRYTKLHPIQIPMRGADVSKDIVEPLMSSQQGFLLISEKVDKRGLGSYEVKGLQSPMKADPATLSHDEYANGASILATLQCVEDWEECNFFVTDYETTKAAFEALLAKAY